MNVFTWITKKYKIQNTSHSQQSTRTGNTTSRIGLCQLQSSRANRVSGVPLYRYLWHFRLHDIDYSWTARLCVVYTMVYADYWPIFSLVRFGPNPMWYWYFDAWLIVLNFYVPCFDVIVRWTIISQYRLWTQSTRLWSIPCSFTAGTNFIDFTETSNVEVTNLLEKYLYIVVVVAVVYLHSTTHKWKIQIPRI